MRHLLKLGFCLFSLLLLIALVIKLILDTSPTSIVVLTACGFIGALYLLFLLEGIQVAGIKIKDSEEVRLDKRLSLTAIDGKKKEKLITMFKIFAGNFDSFVTGRQILVIGTVVFLSFLFNGIPLPAEAPDWLNGIGPERAAFLMGVVDSKVTSFCLATFIPVWVSQLLPQFLADDRPLTFLVLPLAYSVLKLTQLLDYINAGFPAKFLQSIIQRGSGTLEIIPVRRDALFDAATDLYGKGIRKHTLTVNLSAQPRVTEIFQFVISSGPTHSLVYKFSLPTPVPGDQVIVQIDAPESVTTLEPKIKLTANGQQDFEYAVRIPFDKPLPLDEFGADIVTVEISYEAPSYAPDYGQKNVIKIRPFLVTQDIEVKLIPDEGTAICIPEFFMEDSLFDPDGGARRALGASDGVAIAQSSHDVHATITYPAVGAYYNLEYNLETRAD